jgi:hypothetical protein
MNDNLNDLKQLITITESDTDMSVKLGWMTLVNISEEDGLWYLDGNGGHGAPVSTFGYGSKEAALKKVVEWFAKD